MKRLPLAAHYSCAGEWRIDMNRIGGRVVLRESGVGIPDLLVVIYDLDPRTQPEEQELNRAVPTAGDRLGSVLTSRDGSFELTYENTEFQIRNEQERRPDLLLSVLAPEEPGVDPASRVLYVSTEVRQNAGLIENYLIRLQAKQLEKAGITPPSAVTTETEPAKSVIGRLTDNETRRSTLVGAALATAKQQVESRRARFAGFNDSVRPALVNELSAISQTMVDPDRFVKPTENVHTKMVASMQRSIREILNSDDPARRPPARSRVHLTPQQVADLRAQAAPDGTVDAAALAAVAAGNGQTSPTTFVEADDRLPLCRPSTAHGACAQKLLEPSELPPPEPPVVNGNGVAAIDEDDIPRYLARLMETVTAPEEQLLTGLMPVATPESVRDSIEALSFPPSPADVPAYHDFTNLHIAFDSIWQEAIHEGIVELAEDVYEAVVELGGDPTREEHLPAGSVRSLLREGRSTLRTAREVRDHRTGRGQGGVIVRGERAGCGNRDDDDHVVVRDHRSGRQEVVIRGHRTQSGDPAERLPELLQELERRLLHKYAFTVFAANEKERSVNFGLLATYRQIWTPLAYQAGPLVKSIPLAPRQTQKVVISRKTIKKRSRKEIENNLRVTRDEMSSTSRTEQEIIRRAQSKNEFSVENTEKGGVETASHTTTIKFGREATKSSDDVKKSFHEAVFKSAQEIRQERTVEINTEETEEFEQTETTEISNPNDEIAVTFLFYELQRRYRVKEKLQRVVPVVFVAQEFPQPHQINAAWLVAHDWILKRVILDDSFLPTLNALTQAAGNESALAEMRYNVQQQRCIVEELREEVAQARKRATLQQSLLERSIFQKAGVVGDRGGGGGGILGIVGDALDSVTSAASDLAGTVGDLVFGGGSGGDASSNRQAMQEQAQAAADQARELMFRLEREVTALNSLTETYTRALRDHHTLLTDIARLEGHVADNAMYYMQKIWAHEPPDQRYFRLHNVPVPVFSTRSRRFTIDFEEPVLSMNAAHEILPRFGGIDLQAFPSKAVTKLHEDEIAFAPLSQVADLDTLLGFKGNYMIFPLNESNAVTDLMMDPYVDRATGQLVDTADPTNWTIDGFAEYVCCLKEKLTPDELAVLLPQLREQHKAILSASSHQNDVLVVPTNSLFIEALPAGHEVLGNFKRAHRVLDVKSAQADQRARELENVRRTALLLAGERGDPNIDKKITIEGAGSIVVPPNE